MHDAGNSFKFDGELVLLEDANEVVVFPPDQHAELSVLDNKLNAVKNLWRSMRDGADFSYDALLLQHCVDQVKQVYVTKWWKANFMMDVKNLSLDAVKRELSKVKGKTIARDNLKDRYVAVYTDWVGRRAVVLGDFEQALHGGQDAAVDELAAVGALGRQGEEATAHLV